MYQVLKEIQEAAEKAEATKFVKTSNIHASSIHALSTALSYTGVTFREGDGEHLWRLAGEPSPNGNIRFGTTWLNDCLQDLVRNSIWPIDQCEALVRTTLDIILYDRMKILHEECADAARKLDLAGEHNLTYKIKNGQENYDCVAGKADYVIGHCNPIGREMESCFVALQAKTPANFLQAMNQLVVYLAAIQQMRKEQEKLVCTVYGVAMDGWHFRFLRLDENRKLRTSDILTITNSAQTQLIFDFIDSILRAAAHSSPHTTPKKSFPRSSDLWLKNVESKIFDLPATSEGALLEYCTDEDFEDFDSEDEMEISINDRIHNTVVLTPRKNILLRSS